MRSPAQTTSDTLILTDILRALSEPVRLCIVRKLAQDGICNCTELLSDRPKSSMSHHFQVLRDAGLIETRISGVTHLNELRRTAVNQQFPGLLDAILNAD